MFNKEHKLQISDYLNTGKRQPPKEIKNVFIDRGKWDLAMAFAKSQGCPAHRVAQRCMDFAIDAILEHMEQDPDCNFMLAHTS